MSVLWIYVTIYILRAVLYNTLTLYPARIPPPPPPTTYRCTSSIDRLLTQLEDIPGSSYCDNSSKGACITLATRRGICVTGRAGEAALVEMGIKLRPVKDSTLPSNLPSQETSIIDIQTYLKSSLCNYNSTAGVFTAQLPQGDNKSITQIVCSIGVDRNYLIGQCYSMSAAQHMHIIFPFFNRPPPFLCFCFNILLRSHFRSCLHLASLAPFPPPWHVAPRSRLFGPPRHRPSAHATLDIALRS